MHPSALDLGRRFFQTYASHAKLGSILDLGALSVNGGLRPFAPTSARYVGVDLEAGPNVDVVVAPGEPLPFADGAFDAAVSTSCFEHDPAFWATFLELGRCVREGGLLYINAPSNGDVHRWPWDCWRFYPDAGAALASWARRSGMAMTLVESFISPQGSGRWNDCVMVFVRAELETLEGPRLVDGVRGATNIRKLGDETLHAFRRESEDRRKYDGRTVRGLAKRAERAIGRAFGRRRAG